MERIEKTPTSVGETGWTTYKKKAEEWEELREKQKLSGVK